MSRTRLRRRGYLAGLAGVTGLAGCGGSPAEPTERTATASASPTESPTPTRPASETRSETAAPARHTFDGGDAAAFADALDWLAAEPGRTLRLASGTHRFDAAAAPDIDDVRTHFTLDGAAAATIVGEGATVVLEDPTRGWLHVTDAEDIAVRGLTVDYDPLPFTQGIIRSLSDDATALVVDLQNGFPSLDHRVFENSPFVQATVHRRDGGALRRVDGHGGAFKRFDAVERLSDRRFRLRLVEGEGTAGLAAGRLLAIAARFPTARAVRFHRCRRPHLEAVTVRASPGFAAYFNYCAGPVVRDVVIAPPPGSGRVISSCADGVHLDNCREGPLVEGCRIVRTEDDGIVIDTQLIEVTEVVDARTVRVQPSVGSLVAAGDRMEAASNAFERKGQLPPVEVIDQQGGGRTEGPALPERIVFEAAVDDTLAPGDLLTDRAFENRGFAVRDNELREPHARLIRIGGGAEGAVEGNTAVGTNNDGILLEANAGGTPKRWVDDVTVRNNDLRSVGLRGIAAGRPEGIVVNVANGPVHARDRDADLGGRPHRNVAIEGNRVDAIATTGIHLADARNATVSGNRVVDPGRIRMTVLGPYGIGVDHAADVELTGNHVIGTGDGVEGFGWRVASTRVSMSGNRFTVAGEDRAPTLERLVGS